MRLLDKTNIFYYFRVSILQVLYGTQRLAMNGCPPNTTRTAVATIAKNIDFFYWYQICVDFVRTPVHRLWRAWVLRVFARANANSATYY
jgi:hypothetical protein